MAASLALYKLYLVMNGTDRESLEQHDYASLILVSMIIVWCFALGDWFSVVLWLLGWFTEAKNVLRHIERKKN